MVNMGYLEVVIGSPCFTEFFQRFRNWIPSAGTSAVILMPHLITRCCVFIHIFLISRDWFPSVRTT